jgi:hypothetical protein
VLPSGWRTARWWVKLNTGSTPEETLPAMSEMVPVGATEVTKALRMPWAAIASFTSWSSSPMVSPSR